MCFLFTMSDKDKSHRTDKPWFAVLRLFSMKPQCDVGRTALTPTLGFQTDDFIGISDKSRSQPLTTGIADLLDRRALNRYGGARRDRTDDLMLAKHALSQLSYGPCGFANLQEF
jgi:hypothetical protein